MKCIDCGKVIPDDLTSFDNWMVYEYGFAIDKSVCADCHSKRMSLTPQPAECNVQRKLDEANKVISKLQDKTKRQSEDNAEQRRTIAEVHGRGTRIQDEDRQLKSDLAAAQKDVTREANVNESLLADKQLYEKAMIGFRAGRV